MWSSLREFLKVPSELTGRNVRIAVVDSDFPNHPGITTNDRRTSHLIRRTVESESPPEVFESEPGTWTGSWHALCAAAAAGGSGAESGGLYTGVAPEADLFLVKGYPGEPGCQGESAQIRALEWIRANWRKYEIRGVITALRSHIVAGIYPWQTDPRCILCEELAAEGLLVVTASGNRHDETCGTSEAAAPSVLCTGGVVIPPHGDPNFAGIFPGNRGTTFEGKWIPEILAPAENIILPRPKKEDIEDHLNGEPQDLPPLYGRTKGTSFSGPALLGAAACLWQAKPGWTAYEMKSAIIGTSQKKPEWSDLGAGLVSVIGAMAEGKPQTAAEAMNTPYQNWSLWKKKPLKHRLARLASSNHDEAKDAVLSFVGDDFPYWAAGTISAQTEHSIAEFRAASLCALSGAPPSLVNSEFILRAFRDASPLVRMGGVYLLSVRSDLWSKCRRPLEALFNDVSLDVRIGSLDLARIMTFPEFAGRIAAGLEEDARNDRVANFGNRIDALEAITKVRLPFRLPDRRDQPSYANAVRAAKIDLARRWDEWLQENWSVDCL